MSVARETETTRSSSGGGSEAKTSPFEIVQERGPSLGAANDHTPVSK
jgi:hypothetical protein